MSGTAKVKVQYCQPLEQWLDSNLFVTLPGEITDITVRTLARLADALQVSTDYLLGRKGEESEHMPAAVALASA
jgi:hypothetical protein